MTPEAKVDLVKSFQATGELVAIVGDGINDAVALAEADVGIAAFGGTDIAVQSADIVMLEPGLDAVTELIALSQKTRMIIRQNLVCAFIYNLSAIPVAAGLFSIRSFSRMGISAKRVFLRRRKHQRMTKNT